MFQIGTQVVYGLHGICTVTETEERIVDRKQVLYLVLEPIGQKGSKFYVPVHNENAMNKLRKLPDRTELEDLLSSETVKEDYWIPDENRRKQLYRELIADCDQTSMLRMIRTLYHQKRALSSMGRKFHICDDNFLRHAEKLICSEISAIMEIEYDAAKRYLRNRLVEEK